MILLTQTYGFDGLRRTTDFNGRQFGRKTDSVEF